MLDDHLFSINLESWQAKIAVEQGWLKFKLLHGTYHEKFKNMRVGQVWLVKRGHEYYLKVVFSKIAEPKKPDGKALAVNENNITFGAKELIAQYETGERCIRTAYFLKRRRLQSKPRLNEKPLIAKVESRRVEAVYRRVANEIVKKAVEMGCSTILIEDLKGIGRCRKKSKALNGGLNRWDFRKFQAIVEYKAKMAGLSIKPVKAKGTSSKCPICRVKLSPSGHRLMKCPKCGLEEDRDIIAILNLLQKHQINVPSSTVHGENPPMKRGGKNEERNES